MASRLFGKVDEVLDLFERHDQEHWKGNALV